MLAILLNELLWHIQRDAKKLAAVILIVFFAAFTAGFCAAKVVEHSIRSDFHDSKNLSYLWQNFFYSLQ